MKFIFTFQVDRITEHTVKNHLDYDRSDNHDIDVKEALRSTICQKSKSKDVGMTKIILPTSGYDSRRDQDSGSSDIEGSESDYGNRNKKKNVSISLIIYMLHSVFWFKDEYY